MNTLLQSRDSTLTRRGLLGTLVYAGFPVFQVLSSDHSGDAESLWLAGKYRNFCFCFFFYRGREWTTQSGDNPIQRTHPSLRSKALKRFMKLYPQSWEFEAIDTVRYSCKWKKNVIHLCLGVVLAVSTNILMFTLSQDTFYQKKLFLYTKISISLCFNTIK